MVGGCLKYTFLKQIGRGSSASINLALDENKEYVCVKRLKRTFQKNLKREVEIMKEVANDFAVKYIDHYEENERDNIVLELCEYDSLRRLIRRMKDGNREIPFPFIMSVIVEIVEAINSMHKCNIIHRDIKSENILIQNKYTVKLADFGAATILPRGKAVSISSLCGTPNYTSPEVFTRGEFSFKSDIWSLGVVIYELCMLGIPFSGSNRSELQSNVVQEDVPALSEWIDKEWRDLIMSMLEKDPEKRPTASQILESDCVKKFKNSSEWHRNECFSEEAFNGLMKDVLFPPSCLDEYSKEFPERWLQRGFIIPSEKEGMEEFHKKLQQGDGTLENFLRDDENFVTVMHEAKKGEFVKWICLEICTSK